MWLAIQKKSLTRDRLLVFGVCPDNLLRVLCGKEDEKHEHLFFSFQFTKAVTLKVSVGDSTMGQLAARGFNSSRLQKRIG